MQKPPTGRLFHWAQNPVMTYGITDLTTFILGTIFIVLLPGPNSVYVMTVASRRGVAQGYRGACGIFLGDTILMVLSATGVITFNVISSVNPSTIAANIALSFPEAYGDNVSVLIATGLVLFAITLVVNAIARVVVNRRKDFSGAN